MERAWPSNKMDVCPTLARTDRFEIIGNRMTAYADSLGGGSIQYWDGAWINNRDGLPQAYLSIFEGHDGDLILRGAKGRVLPLRRYHHDWRPDRMVCGFLTADRVVVKEVKTVWNDVFVSRLALYSALKRDSFVASFIVSFVGHQAEKRSTLNVQFSTRNDQSITSH